MTLPTSRVVNVAITRESVFPQGPGFGVALLVSPNVAVIPLAERARSYSSIEAVDADFAADDEELKFAQTYFSQNPRPTGLVIGVRDTGAAQIADELQAIQEANNDWYAICLTAEARISDSIGLFLATAGWAETRDKIFVTATNEPGALAAAGGIPKVMGDLGLDRSMAWYHQDANLGAGNAYPEASFLGRMLTVNFDGVDTVANGKFKQFPGIPVSDLTDTELDFLLANKGNAYVSIGNRAMTVEGTMASGEFFDIIHGTDWLLAEIQNRVFGKLATLPRVPMTDRGVEILLNEVRLALTQAVTNGLIAADTDENGDLIDAFSVTAPSVRTLSPADRSARRSPPISFTARYAGAINSVQIDGTITV